MQIESHKNRQNKKAKRLNSIRGTQRFTKPSQTNGGANIRINSETAIPKLKNLAQEYIGVSDPYGFLTNLREALGIPNSQGASKYGVVTIPKEDGSVLEASLRITNHNSDAETYITHNANYEYNLSILVRKNFKPNTFKPHNDVVLDEFVYYGKRMQRVENPLTQIINSIIGFLQSGVYNDTTGVAFKNTSPQTNDNNKLNCNTNMNKKLIRLTESDLHRIVKKSVSKILKESYADDRYNMGTFCNSGDKQYDSLSDKLFAYIEDWGISRQMEGNKTFQEGRKMLHQALKTLEQGFREYNNHDGGGASDGGEGFSDYSGGSLY